jgi:hypothetical protein
MESRYLLDTNICICFGKKTPEEVLRRFQKLRPGEAALSVITYGELLYGAAKSEQPVLALGRLRELVHLPPALAPYPKRRLKPTEEHAPNWKAKERRLETAICRLPRTLLLQD